MARRPTGRNEIQDPSLPQKKRARWRVIGASVLALAAAIVLPLALESEPKRPLADVDVRVPAREFGQPRFSVPAVAMNGDGAVRSDGLAGLVGDPVADTPTPAVAGVQGGRTALEALESGRTSDRRVAQVDLPAAGRVPAPGRSAEPAADAKAGSASPPKAAADAKAVAKADPKPAAKADPKQAARPDATAPAKADARPAAKAGAGQSDAKSAAASPRTAGAAAPDKVASAAPTARATKADPPAPPIPQRRVDRNDPKASSPAGFVIQIGAFSSAKSAQAQADRARKLGFDAYTEKFTTSKGEWTRVRVGPYLSREQADDARSRLKRRGIDTALIAP